MSKYLKSFVFELPGEQIVRYSDFLNCLLVSFFAVSVCLAQVRGQAVDLVSAFKPKVDALAGQWSKGDDGIGIAVGPAARAVLAEGVPKDYLVNIELTRVRGSEVVALILPVGPTSVALELGGWGGESHGLARVDGLPTRSDKNPTSVRPGKLENGRRYEVSVRVAVHAENSTISAQLDGKNLIDWDGPWTRLQPHLVFNLRKSSSLGIASKENDVVFHKVVLTAGAVSAAKPASPGPKPDSAPARDGTLDLAGLTVSGNPDWAPFNGARFTSGSRGESGVVQSNLREGSGDRGAFIDGLNFAEGTIEVELKGDARPQQSFVGVVFGGVDGSTYESVYFRPFNFGIADPVRRSHAVQYIAHPEWPWQRLRDERSGDFEKVVNPEPKANEWFKARVVVSEKTVRVFVNDGKTASLQVERLTERRSGKVGLWFNGIASFRNLRVTSATDTVQAD